MKNMYTLLIWLDLSIACYMYFPYPTQSSPSRHDLPSLLVPPTPAHICLFVQTSRPSEMPCSVVAFQSFRNPGWAYCKIRTWSTRRAMYRLSLQGPENTCITVD